MKYENFDAVVRTIESIRKYNVLLKDIDSDEVTVIINSRGDYGRVMTIGARENYEHDYTQLSIQFIENIKTDLRKRIDNLMDSLSDL